MNLRYVFVLICTLIALSTNAWADKTSELKVLRARLVELSNIDEFYKTEMNGLLALLADSDPFLDNAMTGSREENFAQLVDYTSEFILRWKDAILANATGTISLSEFELVRAQTSVKFLTLQARFRATRLVDSRLKNNPQYAEMYSFIANGTVTSPAPDSCASMLVLPQEKTLPMPTHYSNTLQ